MLYFGKKDWHRFLKKYGNTRIMPSLIYMNRIGNAYRNDFFFHWTRKFQFLIVKTEKLYSDPLIEQTKLIIEKQGRLVRRKNAAFQAQCKSRRRM